MAKKTTLVERKIFDEIHITEEEIIAKLIASESLPADATCEFDVSPTGQVMGAFLRHTRVEKDKPIVA